MGSARGCSWSQPETAADSKCTLLCLYNNYYFASCTGCHVGSKEGRLDLLPSDKWQGEEGLSPKQAESTVYISTVAQTDISLIEMGIRGRGTAQSSFQDSIITVTLNKSHLTLPVKFTLGLVYLVGLTSMGFQDFLEWSNLCNSNSLLQDFAIRPLQCTLCKAVMRATLRSLHWLSIDIWHWL